MKDHINSNFHSKRQQAMKWWNNLTKEEKTQTYKNSKLFDFKEDYTELTGKEIEIMYKDNKHI